VTPSPPSPVSAAGTDALSIDSSPMASAGLDAFVLAAEVVSIRPPPAVRHV